jgi:hypothetical protein
MTEIDKLARSVGEETGLTGDDLMIEVWSRVGADCERDVPAIAHLARVNVAILRGQARQLADGSIEWLPR